MNTNRTNTAIRPKVLTACVAALLALTACGTSTDNTATEPTGATTPVPSTYAKDHTPDEVTLLAYDAFTPPEGIFDEFTKATGAKVKVVTGGDSGAVITKAILTAGNPEGDVLWGIDNTTLQKVQAKKVLNTYTPVDYGDVCVNYSKRWFAEHKLTPPSTIDDLTKTEYMNLLVVQDPVNSSPGLAFLLATIAKHPTDWQDYWGKLKKNGVKISPDWTTAWTMDYSGSGNKGDRPMVVSYGSSPPAEMVFATNPSAIDFPDSGVIEQTCFRLTEYTGVLTGAKNPHLGQQLVDYLLGKTFQSAMPTSLFVWPVNPEATIPPVFIRWAVRATTPLTIPPAEIDTNLKSWLDDWRALAL